ARFVQQLAPHIAEGIRMGLLRQDCDLESPTDGPGLVLLAADGAVAGMNQAAERWLEELGDQPDGSELPIEISALATRLRHLKTRMSPSAASPAPNHMEAEKTPGKLLAPSRARTPTCAGACPGRPGEGTRHGFSDQGIGRRR